MCIASQMYVWAVSSTLLLSSALTLSCALTLSNALILYSLLQRSTQHLDTARAEETVLHLHGPRSILLIHAHRTPHSIHVHKVSIYASIYLCSHRRDLIQFVFIKWVSRPHPVHIHKVNRPHRHSTNGHKVVTSHSSSIFVMLDHGPVYIDLLFLWHLLLWSGCNLSAT